jgi:hypothetical protein
MPGKKAAGVLVKDLRLDAGRLELAQVLLRKTFVRRKENYPIQFPPTAMLVEIVLELKDVRVHHQRLARAGGHPVGQLVELRPRFRAGVE